MIKDDLDIGFINPIEYNELTRAPTASGFYPVIQWLTRVNLEK